MKGVTDLVGRVSVAILLFMAKILELMLAAVIDEAGAAVKHLHRLRN